MSGKIYDDDETEYFERDSYQKENKSGSFYNDDNDDTIQRTSSYNRGPVRKQERYEDEDSEQTVQLRKQKTADILGFIVVKSGKMKNEKFDLVKDDIIIGKSPKCCDFVLDDEGVSRIHCRIRRDLTTNQFLFYDCGSTNGSLINGETVHYAVLKSHDKISIGENIELVFVQV